jgi:TorA maturation chaperone TorD
MMRDEAPGREGEAAERDASPASHLLAQADMLLLAADLLRPGPPRGHIMLPTSADAAELAAAAFPGRADVREALAALLASASETDERRWSDEYHRLFEGPLACPVNETAYIRRDKGAILADLCGFYRAFGFTPASGADAPGEKPDHMCCELEFAAILMIKLASAPASDHDDAAEVTQEALRRFAADHLSEWMASFCAQLAKTTSLPFYERTAELLQAVWQVLIATHDWPAIAPAADADSGEPSSPYECGLATSEPNVELRLGGRSILAADIP